MGVPKTAWTAAATARKTEAPNMVRWGGEMGWDGRGWEGLRREARLRARLKGKHLAKAQGIPLIYSHDGCLGVW